MQLCSQVIFFVHENMIFFITIFNNFFFAIAKTIYFYSAGL